MKRQNSIFVTGAGPVSTSDTIAPGSNSDVATLWSSDLSNSREPLEASEVFARTPDEKSPKPSKK